MTLREPKCIRRGELMSREGLHSNTGVVVFVSKVLLKFISCCTKGKVNTVKNVST